jgi:hypothetical protein
VTGHLIGQGEMLQSNCVFLQLSASYPPRPTAPLSDTTNDYSPLATLLKKSHRGLSLVKPHPKFGRLSTVIARLDVESYMMEMSIQTKYKLEHEVDNKITWRVLDI